jgi:hypothetical protein
MHYERDDDLDRLLFSLPLEEPPADLRASIFATTIYRPAFALRPWELWMLGTLIALAVWLASLIVRGGSAAFMKTLSTLGAATAHVLLTQNTWLWLLAGIGAAFWLLILNPSPMPVRVFERYARR